MAGLEPGLEYVPRPPVRDEGISGPVLPHTLAPEQTSYWVVGVGWEEFGRDPEHPNSLFGLTGMYRYKSIGPHVLLMTNSPGLMSTDPSLDGYEDWRLLGGLGLRGFLPALGTEWSYGVGAHAEIKLRDHFWVGYVTPLELGVVLYARNSWHLELFAGARRAAVGTLINHFIVDPNGFDNENAQDELDDLLHRDPWLGFVRVVFGRRID